MAWLPAWSPRLAWWLAWLLAWSRAASSSPAVGSPGCCGFCLFGAQGGLEPIALCLCPHRSFPPPPNHIACSLSLKWGFLCAPCCGLCVTRALLCPLPGCSPSGPTQSPRILHGPLLHDELGPFPLALRRPFCLGTCVFLCDFLSKLDVPGPSCLPSLCSPRPRVVPGASHRCPWVFATCQEMENPRLLFLLFWAEGDIDILLDKFHQENQGSVSSSPTAASVTKSMSLDVGGVPACTSECGGELAVRAPLYPPPSTRLQGSNVRSTPRGLGFSSAPKETSCRLPLMLVSSDGGHLH